MLIPFSRVFNTFSGLVFIFVTMNYLKFYFLLIGLLVGNLLNAQSEAGKDSVTAAKSLFTEEQSRYIDNWIAEFVESLELSEETAIKYREISAAYSAKFKALENESPTPDKAELIARFNTLMEEQHREMEAILTKAQFKAYFETMDKVAWSVNERLKRL